MYLVTCTHPHISYTVSSLARCNSNPGLVHSSAIKHFFHYLKSTMDLCLGYGPSASPQFSLFNTYHDADHAGDLEHSRSTGGYVLTMGTGAVSWSSKLQPLIALSTTKAEDVNYAIIIAFKEFM